MSEINFLPDDGKQKEDKGRAKASELDEIAYSKPKELSRSGQANFEKVPASANATGEEESKSKNLREQRKVVLSSIKKDKQNTGQIISSKTSFFSTIKDKLEAVIKKKEPAEKKDKEILAETKEIFEKEKSERKNYSGPGENIAAESSKNKKLKEKDKWESVKVLKTNLIQDEVTVFVDWTKHLKLLLVYLSGVFLLIVFCYGGLIFWGMQVSQEKKVKSIAIEDLKQKIVGLSGKVKEIQNFQKELALAGSLLSKHIYWTNFFEFLEKNTLANVYYSGGFSGDTQGKYSFAATTDSFRSISDQVAVMRNSADVLDVSVESGDLSASKKSESEAAQNTVSFQMNLDLDSGLFTPLGKNPIK